MPFAAPALFRRFRLLLWILLGGGIVLAAVLYKVSDALADFAMTIPLAAHSNWTPATAGIAYETREATASDGVHLKGWWIPADEKDRPRGLPAVMVIHGLGAGKEFMVGYIILAHREGHPVLAIDLRGHGESDPGLTTLGYKEPLDVAAWMKVLAQEGQHRVILWGTSMGAVTALRGAAAVEKADGPVKIAGVIADAPFDTLPHTMKNHARLFFHLPPFPIVNLTELQVRRKFGFNTVEVDSVAAAHALHAPLLVMAAENDERMPLPQVRSIYEAAASSTKAFYLIPGETHETRHFAPAFQETLTTFLRRCSEPVTGPEPTRATAGVSR